VLTGPPGAGKSTIARLVADRLPLSVHLVADVFWHHLRSGYVLPWLPEAHRQNQVTMEAVAAAAGEFASGGYDVVVDGVIGPWLLDPFLRRADEGLGLTYVVLRPDETTTVARAVARGAADLVEEGPVRHMYAQFSGLGDYERYVLDTTELSTQESVDRVLNILLAATNRLPMPGSRRRS
jgi:cytidylate kinase